MGVKAIFPFGSPHVLFHLGLENYATFWNPNDAEGQRLERAPGLQPRTLLDASLGVNRTNVLMLNFGVSLRVLGGGGLGMAERALVSNSKLCKRSCTGTAAVWQERPGPELG